MTETTLHTVRYEDQLAVDDILLIVLVVVSLALQETVVLHVGLDRTLLLLVGVDRTSTSFVSFEDEDPEEAIFPLENSVVYYCIEDHC